MVSYILIAFRESY